MNRHPISTALSRFQLAEAAAMRRARGALGISDTDLHALRHLLAAEARDERLTARELAISVGISAAGATFLIDRLEKEGYVRREPHPGDRRAVHVVSTIPPRSEVRHALSRIDAPIDEVAGTLSGHDAGVVAEFVKRVTEAMGEVDPAAPDEAHATPQGRRGR